MDPKIAAALTALDAVVLQIAYPASEQDIANTLAGISGVVAILVDAPPAVDAPVDAPAAAVGEQSATS